MKSVAEHIAHIHTKPHHVRKQVAFTVAGVGTGFVALLWLGLSLGTGAFVLKETSFADAGKSAVVTVAPKYSQAVAGVAAASSASGPARIEIVDTPQSTIESKSQPTTIPF